MVTIMIPQIRFSDRPLKPVYGDAGVVADGVNFSNFGSLKSTETV